MSEANGYQLSPELEQSAYTPTPSQLRKIALKALLVANRMDSLKKVRTARTISSLEPSIGWVSRYHDKDKDEEVDEVVSCLLTRRIFAASQFESQVEEPISTDAWSLRYRHSSQVKKNGRGQEWQGQVSQYAFEWDSTSTLTSVYKTDALPSITQDEIDRTWVLDVQGAIPRIDALTGEELDISIATNATPTVTSAGVADVNAYAHIMDTLDNHIAKIAA